MQSLDVQPCFVGFSRDGDPRRFVLMAAVRDSDQTYVLIRDLKTNKNVIERARVTHAHPDITTCDYEQIEDDQEFKKVYQFLDGTGIFKKKLKFLYLPS